jgi:low affinity Fe/Cu permease
MQITVFYVLINSAFVGENNLYIIKFQDTWQIYKQMDSAVCYNVLSTAGIIV